MTGLILQTAGELIGQGIPADRLAYAIPHELEHRYGAWADAVLAGEELVDIGQLADLVAAGVVDLAEADGQIGLAAELAVLEAEHELAHPEPGDSPYKLRREVERRKAVHDRRL